MVQSRVKKIEIKEEEKKTIPQEVLSMQGLLMSSGWKHVMERIDETIDETKELVLTSCPLGLTDEGELLWHRANEKRKVLAECYRELQQLPYVIMAEHGETSFEIDNSNKV